MTTRSLFLLVWLFALVAAAVWGMTQLLHDSNAPVPQVASAQAPSSATPTVAADMVGMHGQHMMGPMPTPGMEGPHMMEAMTTPAPTAASSGANMTGQHIMGPMPTPGMEGPHMMGSMTGMAHGEAIPSQGVPAATEKQGGQPLAPRVENGVKIFNLTARPVRWHILNDVTVTAWTYNGTVPGPMIRVTEGDKVRVLIKNELPEATAIHWHGIPVPNAMDGVPPFTQKEIKPGETFTYEFVAPPAGSFMYHSHVETDKQIMIGLYAPLIVEPKGGQKLADVDATWMLSEWRVGEDGETYPAMPMTGAEPNFFTINGKAFPQSPTIEVKKGQKVRIRFAGIGQFTHPMHLHGMNFKIAAYDGVPVPEGAQVTRNTLPLNPGEVVDIEFVAENPGTWVFHCHVLHHVTNNGVEPGGLIGVIQISE